jgi:glycosyltransferase involved in cell wall biosynthesis
MRILVILNGASGGYSGGDLHTIAVINNWAKEHTVTLLLPAGSSHAIRQSVDGRIAIRGRKVSEESIGRVRLLARYVVRSINASIFVLRGANQWDVVVASSHYAFDLLPMMLDGSSRRIVYWHHHAERLAQRPTWVRVLVKLSESWSTVLLRRSRALVFTSNSQTFNYLVSRGISRKQVVLTQNGPSLVFAAVSDLNRGNVDASPSPSTPHRTVLFCGRLSRLKGTRDIASIAPSLTRPPHDARLILIGQDGDGAESLKSILAPEIAEGRVIVAGFVDEATKARLFREAHVLASPSYEEGWSIAVGDGLAAGCWVVAYDIPAVREAFPVGPRYVPVGDSQALFSEVLHSLTLPRPNRPFVPVTWEDIAEREMNAICRS